MIGVTAQGRVVGATRFLKAACLLQRVAEISIGLRVVGLQPDGVVIGRQRRLQAARLW